jgi:hypothetical protein
VFSEHQEIKLNLDEFKRFNEQLVSSWDTIVNDAPEDWKADGFLLENAPVGITCRYGQDALIGALGRRAAEGEEFEKERHWKDVRTCSIALATDIRYPLPSHYRIVFTDLCPLGQAM